MPQIKTTQEELPKQEVTHVHFDGIYRVVIWTMLGTLGSSRKSCEVYTPQKTLSKRSP